jgi:hypothetical protein
MTRKRTYETANYYDVTPPQNLPNWAYYSEREAEESVEKHKKRKVAEESSTYSEEYQTGESAIMGEVREAVAKAKSVEGIKIGKKKITEKKEKKRAQIGVRRSPRIKSNKGKEKEVEEVEEEEEETEDNE